MRKKTNPLMVLFLLSAVIAHAQVSDYKVVFDMTSKDSLNQQTLIRELTLIKESNPGAKLEVVVYAHGLDLVVKGRSSQQEAVERLARDQNVDFRVCAITLKRNNVDPSQLVTGVKTVADGIYEIISKQREGWGYIKVGR